MNNAALLLIATLSTAPLEPRTNQPCPGAPILVPYAWQDDHAITAWDQWHYLLSGMGTNKSNGIGAGWFNIIPERGKPAIWIDGSGRVVCFRRPLKEGTKP